jgi:hypothetical protein
VYIRILQNYMLNRSLLILVSLLIQSVLWGQGSFLHLSTAGIRANGNQMEAVQNTNSIFGNQAGLAFLEKRAFIFTAENRYLLGNIFHAGAGYALPLKSGTFGFSAATFGNEYYRENNFGLSFARKLSEGTALGAQINYNWLQVAEGGNQGNVQFDLGLQQKITSFLHIGFHVRNPIRRSYANGYVAPSIFRLGSRLIISKKVNLYLAVEKETDQKENIKVGFDYNIHPKFIIRSGLQTRNQIISTGVGLFIKDNLIIDISGEWQPIIGVSPAITCTYTL